MRTRTLALTAVAAIVVASALATAPGAAAPGAAATAARRCSMLEFPSARRPDDVVLVGVALATTARAGAGDVEFDVPAGADRAAVRRAVRGHLVHVAALDRRARAQLPAGTTRVLLVPWAYGADCATGPWDHGPWLAPGTRGLFVGDLRPPARWADGVPTIDVRDPYQLPYTGRPRGPRDAAAALTPDELLELYDAVRAPAELAGARTAVRAWVRAHPDLARRRPAATLLNVMREPGEAHRFHNASSPILGTWRLEASLDDGASRTGWVRTWDRTSHATSAPPSPAEVAADPLAPVHVSAYHAVAAGDATRLALPTAGAPMMVARGGYLRVSVPHERAPLDAGPWRGAFETDVLAHAFAHDAAIAAFLRDAVAERRARHRALVPEDEPATFTRDADDTLRAEQRMALADGRTLVLRGERVSPEVIRDGPRLP